MFIFAAKKQTKWRAFSLWRQAQGPQFVMLIFTHTHTHTCLHTHIHALIVHVPVNNGTIIA